MVKMTDGEKKEIHLPEGFRKEKPLLKKVESWMPEKEDILDSTESTPLEISRVTEQMGS